tara:strand:- start:496 stop:711 length:216 start_codon:yes stop_codon:yes gene_type:complete
MIAQEKVKSSIEEVQKSQIVRLADVFFIAPFMFYIASKKTLTPLDRNIMFGLAFATLFYNAKNYIENRNDG